MDEKHTPDDLEASEIMNKHEQTRTTIKTHENTIILKDLIIVSAIFCKSTENKN